MLGLWIDRLTEVERDRIVTGQGWGTGTALHADGSRCLVGQAAGLRPSDVKLRFADDVAEFRDEARARVVALGCAGYQVGARFDRLVCRFGLARVVRLVKARASSVSSRDVERLAPVRGEGALAVGGGSSRG